MGSPLMREFVAWEGSAVKVPRFRLLDAPKFVSGVIGLAVGLFFALVTFPVGLFLPPFWIGFYFLFVWPFVEPVLLSHSTYLVTKDSLLIIRDWPFKSVRSRPRSLSRSFDLKLNRNGSKTLVFERAFPPVEQLRYFHRRPFAFEYLRLQDVEDAMKAVLRD